ADELRFKPDVPDGSEIPVLDAGKAGGRRHGLLHNRVTRFGMIEREIDGHPVIEQPGLEADFELRPTLWGEVWIPHGRRNHRGSAVAAGHRLPRPERRKRLGLLAGLAVGRAQFERVERAAVAFAGYVAGTQFRIGDPIEVLAEGAVVVHPDGSRHVQLVPPGDLLLAKHAYRGVFDEVVEAA